MRIFPPDGLSVLEFDKVLKLLSNKSTHARIKQLVESITPTSDTEKIKALLNETEEYRQILYKSVGFPALQYADLSKIIKSLHIENAVLELEDFVTLRNVSSLVNEILDFLNDNAQQYKALSNLSTHLYSTDEIINRIDSVIDKKGEVKNSASRELEKIRKELHFKRREADKRFVQTLNKLRKEGMLQSFDESFVNGRRVLAVFAEHKRMVKGAVLGSSEKASTVYIEPTTTIELNREVDELIFDEKKEIFRILRELTRKTKQFSALIIDYDSYLTRMEVCRIKALLAIELHASLPKINADKQQLNDAKHPLLYLQAQQNGKKLVPLNLFFNEKQRILVISGPNAGGKSIALKTTGLLQIMLQSGMLVPCEPTSSFCIYNKLMVDLGDSQSIEYELSTYSSKLQKMKSFLQVADANSLLLIDEFGTGSDPELGGAIAEAVLENINKSKCYGLVTTHYNNIKLMAENVEGIKNACMLFDSQGLKPRYELFIGQPGSSYTFEVAKNIGLQEFIIKDALQKAKGQSLNFEKLITEYQQKIDTLNKQKNELLIEKKELKKQQISFEELNQDLQHRLKADKEKAVERTRLMDLGKQFQQLLNDWELAKNKKALIDKFSKKFSSEKIKELEKLKLKQKKRKSKKKPNAINIDKKPEVGDTVRLKGGGSEKGIISEIVKNKAHVNFGFIKSIVELEKLVVVKTKTNNT